MTPFLVPPPPVQGARFQPGFVNPSAETVSVQVRPIPPQPSRMEPRRAELDEWGRMSLQGLAGDRYVVPAPEASAPSTGALLCGAAAFLVASALLSK